MDDVETAECGETSLCFKDDFIGKETLQSWNVQQIWRRHPRGRQSSNCAFLPMLYFLSSARCRTLSLLSLPSLVTQPVITRNTLNATRSCIRSGVPAVPCTLFFFIYTPFHLPPPSFFLTSPLSSSWRRGDLENKPFYGQDCPDERTNLMDAEGHHDTVENGVDFEKGYFKFICLE